MTSSSIYPYFLLIKQLFKTNFLPAKRDKVQLLYVLIIHIILYSYYTFSLRETNDFVLTSLKAATQIPPPPPIALEIFK